MSEMGQSLATAASSLFTKRCNYEFELNSNNQLVFNLLDKQADRILARVRKQHLHPFWLTIDSDNFRKIACVHIKVVTNPRYTLLCSHGGTTTLGSFLINFFSFYFFVLIFFFITHLKMNRRSH